MSIAERTAAQQEAEMLKHLGIDESKVAARKQAGPSPDMAGRQKFIRGHEPQRRVLKQSGMDEWEIDCVIAEQIGEPPPPMPPGRTNAPLIEVGSMADGTAASVPAEVLSPAGQQSLKSIAAEAVANLPPGALDRTFIPPPYIEPVEMSDEEMAAAIARVRAAKHNVATTSELLAEVEQALADARAELVAAQREVAAGAAWLTQ